MAMRVFPSAQTYALEAQPYEGFVSVTMTMLRSFMAYLIYTRNEETLESKMAAILWLVDLNAAVRLLRMRLIINKQSGTIR